VQQLEGYDAFHAFRGPSGNEQFGNGNRIHKDDITLIKQGNEKLPPLADLLEINAAQLRNAFDAGTPILPPNLRQGLDRMVAVIKENLTEAGGWPEDSVALDSKLTKLLGEAAR
jgi:hypothetical protein